MTTKGELMVTFPQCTISNTVSNTGAPNDLLNNFNPLTIIVFAPFLTHVFYPALNKYGIKFPRITRCIVGFILAIACGVVGSILQYRVYKTR